MSNKISILLFISMFLLFNHGSRSDDWLCTKSSGYVSGNVFYACGVGTALNEETARLSALRSAKAEFINLCQASRKCRLNETKVNLGRTDCKKENNQYKCYRLIEYHLTDKMKSNSFDPVAIDQLIEEKKAKAHRLITEIKKAQELKSINEELTRKRLMLKDLQQEAEELIQNYPEGENVKTLNRKENSTSIKSSRQKSFESMFE